MNYNTEVGKKIFDTRKLRGMTRVELGKIVNLHETTIKKYEEGNIKNISIEVLKRFAAALNIEAEYLIGWDEKNGVVYNEKLVPNNTDEDVHSFTIKLVQELLQADIIDDKDNIPPHIIDLIVSALKADAKQKKGAKN